MKLKIKYLLAILLMFITFSSSVYAKPIQMTNDTTENTQENLSNQQNNKKGSITIHLEEAGKYTSIEDVEFSLFEIADVIDGVYVLNEKYRNTNIDLNSITTASELEKTSNLLASYIKENNYEPNKMTKTDTKGICEFKDLDIGVYLMIATNTKHYDDVTPFIIAVPTFDDSLLEMSYDIDVYPKHSPTLLSIQILKLDKEDHTKVLKDATFTLYDGEMNELNNATTNKAGIAMFTDLPFGDYYIKETSAPAGYKTSDELVEVRIDGNYDEDRIYEISFENEELPSYKTGDNEPVSMFVGIGMLSFATLLILYKMKQSKSA